MGTENVRVVEVDVGVLDGVAGIDECLTFSVELDGVAGFVDPIVGEDEGFVAHFLCLYPDIFLIHILDVAD